MKVEEFVEKMKKNPTPRINGVLKIEEYIPLAEKRELAKITLDACASKENGYIKVDSVTRYALFTMLVISKYTDLEFSGDTEGQHYALDDYDLLCQNQLLDPVIESFKVEYGRCNEILNMMTNDLLAQNTVSAVVAQAANRIANMVDIIGDGITEKLDQVNLNDIDISNIASIVNQLK